LSQLLPLFLINFFRFDHLTELVQSEHPDFTDSFLDGAENELGHGLRTLPSPIRYLHLELHKFVRFHAVAVRVVDQLVHLAQETEHHGFIFDKEVDGGV